MDLNIRPQQKPLVISRRNAIKSGLYRSAVCLDSCLSLHIWKSVTALCVTTASDSEVTCYRLVTDVCE
jgi:hypothetical protein